MYSVFFITSNLERIFEYSSQVWCMKTLMKTGRYMQKFYPFSKFCGFMSEKWVLFLISPLPLENYPFFSKMGTSMDVRFGREWGLRWGGLGDGGGWGYCVGTWRCGCLVTFFCYHMMPSLNGKIFRVTGHLCGEFPHKGQWHGALMFLWFAPE